MELTRIQEAAEALTRLDEIAQLIATRPDLVRIARAGGIDWDTIALAAGVSRSTAINLVKVPDSE